MVVVHGQVHAAAGDAGLVREDGQRGLVLAVVPPVRAQVGSGGFEKVLIGTRGARETLLRGRKGRAAKNSVVTSGVKQLKC